MQFRSRRHLTRFQASLTVGEEALRVEIADVTEKGARVRLMKGELAPETPVELHLRGRSHAAVVVWAKEDEAGIAFDRILPIDVLATINHRMRQIDMSKIKKRRFLIS
ncbi:MAG: PilZ domain-containing protein [Silicimonas sp.]|jgi:hypothetical protein|nr:PilZ domain-containing protein [Silicimonas sp.]